MIDLNTDPPVSPPTNIMIVRTAADKGLVMFERQSLWVIEVRYYIADDPSSPDLVCVCMYTVIISPLYQFVTCYITESICWQH